MARALKNPATALDRADIIGGDSNSPIFSENGKLKWSNLYLLPAHYDLALMENKIIVQFIQQLQAELQGG